MSIEERTGEGEEGEDWETGTWSVEVSRRKSGQVGWDRNVQKRRKKRKRKLFGHATCGRGMTIARSNRTRLDQVKVTYSIRCESLSESEISTHLYIQRASFPFFPHLPPSPRLTYPFALQ